MKYTIVCSFAAIKRAGSAGVRTFFEKHYADAVPLLGGWDNVERQFLENPVVENWKMLAQL